MPNNAVDAQGCKIFMGQGDAASVDDGTDTFDEISQPQSFTAPGKGREFRDRGHLASIERDVVIGRKAPKEMTATFDLCPGDAGQTACDTAADASPSVLKNFRIVLPDAVSMYKFKGYVAGWDPDNASEGNDLQQTLTVKVTEVSAVPS